MLGRVKVLAALAPVGAFGDLDASSARRIPGQCDGRRSAANRLASPAPASLTQRLKLAPHQQPHTDEQNDRGDEQQQNRVCDEPEPARTH